MSTKLARPASLMMAAAVATVAMAIPTTAGARTHEKRPVVHELTSFAEPSCESGCGSGSTIGPDRALYVTDGPGGRVRVFEPGRLVTYTSTRPGLPDAYHERHFEGDEQGFDYRLVVAYEPRNGTAGLVDHVLLPPALRRAFERTLNALDREVRPQRRTAPE